jgi:hypothetical protein
VIRELVLIGVEKSRSIPGIQEVEVRVAWLAGLGSPEIGGLRGDRDARRNLVLRGKLNVSVRYPFLSRRSERVVDLEIVVGSPNSSVAELLFDAGNSLMSRWGRIT